MRCHALSLLLCWWLRGAGAAGPGLTLGALGAWTAFEPDILIALVAANLDFRKNFEAPVQDRFGPPIVQLGQIHANLSDVGLWIGTTDARASTGIATAIDMMLGLNGHSPVIGLIGASTSSVSTPIASVAASQQVPQISFSATSSALSNKVAYPYFLRTLPPDNLQARALWQWLEEFKVQRATVIYSTESYGEELWESIRVLQQQAGKQILSGQPLPYMPSSAFSNSEARRVAAAAENLGSKILLLFVSQSMLLNFVNVLKEERFNMLGPEWQVLGSDSCNSLTYVPGVLPAGFMLFDFVGRGQLFPRLEELWQQLQLEDIVGAEATAMYHLDEMKVALDHPRVAALLSRDVGGGAVSSYAAFAFDAYYAYLFAINAMLQRGLPETSIRGEVLLEELKKTRFTGVSGDVQFDENGDRMSSYELWNLQPKPNGTESVANSSAVSLRACVVADFSLASENFTFRETELMWMDGSEGRIMKLASSGCSPGYFASQQAGRCMPCPKGTFCPGQDSRAQNCERGYFSKVSGASSCEACPPGTFTADKGMSICSYCNRGEVAPGPGNANCTRCEIGKYMNVTRGEQCYDCGLQQITSQNGAQSESECRCETGSFMCAATGCTPCPAGLKCTGEGLPEQAAGFWTPAIAPGGLQCDFSVLRCRNQRECPEGLPGSCAEGREGLACNNCMPKHYPYDAQCLACEEQDVLPTLLFLAAAAVLMILFSWSKVDSLNLLTAAAVTSQVIMAVQALGSIRELAVEWPYPVRRFIDLTRLLTLNFDIIRLGCIYGSDSPILKMVSQLLVCPIGCASFFLLACLTSRLTGRPVPLDTSFSRCGMLLFAFFLSITLRNLLPFQCVQNPDGSSSMVSQPGIICYDSEEHVVLILLAIVGLFQPFLVLCWATFATITFPSRIASGRGLRLVNRYRFLFHRFKPDCFYYGLFLLYRNGLIALLPVVFVKMPEVQVPFMGIVLLISMALQSQKYPWRTLEANYVELLLTGFLLVILMGAAPLLEIDIATSSETLGWMLCVPVVGLVLPAVLAVLMPIWTHLKPKGKFGIFLCHHKAGAGSLCRLMKIFLSRHSKAKVFLDCDQLQNLDFLFDVVRSSTRSVVVVLTPELLKRVWCAGEIATAYSNGVLTVPLLCDGFRPMEESLKVLTSYWNGEQLQVLATHGISLEDVHRAYRWMQQDLKPLRMPRFGRVWRREAAVVELLHRCELPCSSTAAQIMAAGKHYNPKGARILITSCVADAEALSACEAFQSMLQSHLHVECAVAQNSRQMERWRPRAYYLVVLLFRGVFQDQRLGNILSYAFDTSVERSLEVVTVVADTHFDFLGLNLTRSRSTDSTEQLEEKEQMSQGVYRRLLNVVALPFSPLASDSLQKKQVAEISLRFHRYQDCAEAAVRDAVDDQLVVEKASDDAALAEFSDNDTGGPSSVAGGEEPKPGHVSPECPYLLTTASFGSDVSDPYHFEDNSPQHFLDNTFKAHEDDESDAFSM